MDTSQDEQPLQQIVDVEEKEEEEELLDEDDDGAQRDDDAQKRTTEGLDQRNDGEDLDDIREVTPAQKIGLRRTTIASRNTQENQEKRPKRGARIEKMLQRFLEKREEETSVW